MEHWDNSRCCCRCPDGHECYRERYQRTTGGEDDADPDDQECECACHAEYRRNLEDAGVYEQHYP